MNRATARETIFAGDGDYAAFERVLAEAREREAGRIRVCAYALMPNHFHLVLWPQSGEDEAVSGRRHGTPARRRWALRRW